MAAGDVILNDIGYFVRPRTSGGRQVLIEEQQIEAFAPEFRIGGQQEQVGLRQISTKVFGPLTAGFGRDYIPSQRASDPSEYRYFRDSTCDTRWSQIEIGILNEDSTETGLEVVRASASFKGNLWAIWEDDTSTDVVARRYVGSTTTWTAGGNVLADGNTKVGLDLIAHKTHLLALIASQNDHLVYRSTDGASWSAASAQPTANLLSNSITANEDIDAGLLAEIGGEAVAIVWDEAGGQITFFSSTNAGDNWTDEAVDIPSGNGPQGVAVMAGIDNADKLYVATREGIWEVDTSPSTWTTRLIDPLPVHNDNGRRMQVRNGRLWYGIGVDNDSPAPVRRMSTLEGIRQIEDGWGLNVGDGVPSDMLGPIKRMKVANDMLFACVGGGKAERQARVLCHVTDPITGDAGWHHMFQNGTANQLLEWMDISADDDDTQRLHFAVRTASGTSDTQFLGNALVNPQSGVSVKRQTSGYIDFPQIDGGMPGIDGTWSRIFVNAASLSATVGNEYIQITHGLEGASRTTTTLGSVTSSTTFVTYGSGAGESGVSDAVRAVLYRDSVTNTDSPGLRTLEVHYLKQPDVVERLIFTVDLQQTATNRGRRATSETVLKNLKTARDLKTFPVLQFGNSPRMYVKVRLNPFYEFQNGSRSGPVAPDTLLQRTGFCEVTCEEVVSLIDDRYGSARYGSAEYA